VESLLGVRLQDKALHFAPCLPAGWSGFALEYRWGSTVYAIEVVQAADAASGGALSVVLDGMVQAAAVLPLQDDGVAHTVVVKVPT
jgi:cellobiose phosphorylase